MREFTRSGEAVPYSAPQTASASAESSALITVVEQVPHQIRRRAREAILEELHLGEQYKLIDRGSEPADALAKADFLVDQMRTAFDDALVSGWEALDGTYGLPDPDDEHVVAAAVVGNAGVIVTDNLKDFPAGRVPSHINVITGSEFAENTADVNPEAAVRALVAISKRHKLTPQTPRELLRTPC